MMGFAPLISLLLFAPTRGAVHNVICETTAGDLTIELDDWLSPKGVSRFLELVDEGFFEQQVLYRVIPGFLMQFGVAADPDVQAQWQDNTIPDEPKKAKFEHGTISFAGSGEDSRSCHIFIAFKPDGLSLGDAHHETPLGRVVDGIEVLDTVQQNFIKSGYGDLSYLQETLVLKGNEAVSDFPLLDKILQCAILVLPGQTLSDTVTLISEGEYANNFFSGEPELFGTPRSPAQEVGLCLLDKASAILYEDPASDFASDFKFDLGACCTRRDAYPMCIQEISPIYEAFGQAANSSVEMEKHSFLQKSFAGLVMHAKPLLAGAVLGERAKLLIELCDICDAGTCANLTRHCNPSLDVATSSARPKGGVGVSSMSAMPALLHPVVAYLAAMLSAM